ncbi:MAG: dihydrofolate reductase family protein [Actinomycetota bacterium]|nr:dihydrofolate reductase family protein [Actinomycetota bacterium]
MSKLIVSEFVTLDGVMEAPGGEPGHPHSGWVFDFMGPEQEQYKFEETRDSDALLLGRVTYEGFAEAWPGRSGEFADKFNSMPKHVATTTLTSLEWQNSSVIEGDVPEGVAKLKDRYDGPLVVHGSRTLVHTLFNAGLIDELRLMIFPVVLGSGIKVFPETGDKTTFKLSESRAFESGVVVNTYEPS